MRLRAIDHDETLSFEDVSISHRKTLHHALSSASQFCTSTWMSCASLLKMNQKGGCHGRKNDDSLEKSLYKGNSFLSPGFQVPSTTYSSPPPISTRLFRCKWSMPVYIVSWGEQDPRDGFKTNWGTLRQVFIPIIVVLSAPLPVAMETTTVRTPRKADRGEINNGHEMTNLQTWFQRIYWTTRRVLWRCYQPWSALDALACHLVCARMSATSDISSESQLWIQYPITTTIMPRGSSEDLMSSSCTTVTVSLQPWLCFAT